MFPSKTTLIALILVLGATSSGFARDDIENYSIRQALASPDAREKVDPHIKLFFGKQNHGPVARNLGEWKANKRANSFARADEVACQRAFLSAIISLQQRARKLGGNAVIGIKSYFKAVLTSSNTTYVCGSGGLMSGVTLIGKVVKMER